MLTKAPVLLEKYPVTSAQEKYGPINSACTDAGVARTSANILRDSVPTAGPE